jgi:hypothetical protein
MYPESLLAGAAQIDITPWPGVQLAGDIGRYRAAKLVLDPLYARVLVLRQGERALVIIALDLCIVTKAPCDAIRRAVADRYGVAFDAVMVHAIQTHTAPGLGHFMLDDDFTEVPDAYAWIRGGDPEYDRFVIARVLDAMDGAFSGLQPASVGSASGIEARYAFNRRAIMRDGSIGMPWKGWQGGKIGPANILYMEGSMDPEVGVTCFRGEDLRPLALLLNYACHPVHVFPQILISADWPGAWATEMQARHGGKAVPLVLNGCCGNLNPWPPFDPHYVEDHRVMGHALAEMASNALEEIEYQPSVTLDWRVRRLQIPFRQFDPDAVAAAEAYIVAHPEPEWTDDSRTAVTWEWMMAASRCSIERQRTREGVFDYEIQVLRVGDTAFVGLPGEPFIEGALAIKLASPVRHTYVVHMISQYVGYIPTRDALPRGGHECSHVYWSKLAPEALETIVAAAVEMLGELFAPVAAE